MSRNLSLDLLRILACISVIVIHTAGSPIYHGMCLPGSEWYKECMLMDGLVRWSVPVFAMLTGYFMIDPDKNLPITKLFSKYITRIAVALLVWSVFYSLMLHTPVIPLGSQSGHLWYLNMLIILYLSMPVLRLIALNAQVLSFFCIGWFVLMTYQFFGNYITLPISFKSGLWFEYAGFSLSAYLIKSILHKISSRGITFFYGLGGIGLILTIYAGITSEDGFTYFYSYTSPSVILTALALFLFFLTHTIRIPRKAALIVEEISKCTFGIYLVHMWILILIFTRIHRFIPQPVPLCLVCVSIVFGGGLAVTWIVRRIPLLNRFIV